MRIDEGFTLLYQRQSWGAVLGFEGFYAPHPPLFFALSKAADLVLREEISARWVAALSGTISIPLLYSVGSRLLNRLTGVLAATLLIVAPTHIEFSRDGRMYAPVMMVVLLSYLALIEYRAEPRVGWAVTYGFSISIAVYLDYSAVYALAPQVVLLAMIFFQHGRRATWLAVASVIALILYAPWLPQVVDTVKTLDESSESTNRLEALSASWINIERSISYLLGLSGRGSSPLGTKNVWEQWPDARPLMIVFMTAVGFGGLFTMRGKAFAQLVTLLLVFGAPVVAIIASQISPGYAVRTVQISVMGWCIAAGSCASWMLLKPWTHHYLRVTGGALLLILLMLSGISLRATMSGAERYQWRVIASDLVSSCAPDAPIIVASNAGMFTDILSVYSGDSIPPERILTVTDGTREGWTGAERWLNRGPTRAELNQGTLSNYVDQTDPRNDVIWVATRLSSVSVPKALTSLGYDEVIKRPYHGATLSLWTKLPPEERGVLLARCS